MIFNHFKKYKAVYSYLLTAFCIFFFFRYINKHWDQFKALSVVSWANIILLTVLAIVFKVIIGFKFKLMLELFKLKLKFKEWFGLPCISTMANYLLPARAGIATQAVYMKKVHKFEYSNFTIYLASFSVFVIAANSFAGVFFLLLYYLIYGKLLSVILTIFVIMSLFSVIAMLLLPHLHKLKSSHGFLNRVIQGFSFIKFKRYFVAKLLVVQFCDIVITGIRLYFAYRALGIHVGLLPVLIIGLFATISAIISLTPANLGIRELFITASSMMIGETATSGIMVSLIDRAIGSVITFIFGLWFMYALKTKNNG